MRIEVEMYFEKYELERLDKITQKWNERNPLPDGVLWDGQMVVRVLAMTQIADTYREETGLNFWSQPDRKEVIL